VWLRRLTQTVEFKNLRYLNPDTIEIKMPLTKISAPRHLSSNQVQALAAAVQDGLVKTCNVPPNDLFQLISRFDSEEIILDPHFSALIVQKMLA